MGCRGFCGGKGCRFDDRDYLERKSATGERLLVGTCHTGLIAVGRRRQDSLGQMDSKGIATVTRIGNS